MTTRVNNKHTTKFSTQDDDVVCYLTKHAFSHQQQRVQNSQNVKHNNVHIHLHIFVNQNSSDIIYCVTIINFNNTSVQDSFRKYF